MTINQQSTLRTAHSCVRRPITVQLSYIQHRTVKSLSENSLTLQEFHFSVKEFYYGRPKE